MKLRNSHDPGEDFARQRPETAQIPGRRRRHGRRRGGRAPPAAERHRAGKRGRSGAGGGAQDRDQAHRLQPLLGRLLGGGGGQQRGLGAPGSGLRFADQHGRPLRQGRLGARARLRRTPPALSDEAGERQVRAHLLGPGHQRDRRQAPAAAPAVRPGRADDHRQLEAQQRAGLPAAQMGLDVGQQQLRPPGAHLPLDHRGGRGPDLRLRRDDELLQRPALQQGRDVHRFESGRGPPDLDAALPARQGTGRQDDRRRSALHAHGALRPPLRAGPPGHRHRAGVGHPVAHLRERLGRQGLHRRPHQRHGRGAQGSREMDAGQGHRRDRRAGSLGAHGGRDAGEEPPSSVVWCMGITQHHVGTANVRALSILQLALGNIGIAGRRRQHLPRPRQRAGRHRHRPERRFAAGLLRHRRRRLEALLRRLGRRIRVDQVALRLQGTDGKAGHHGLALVRCGAGRQPVRRPAEQPARRVLLGPRAEQPDPPAGHEEGDAEARHAGGGRPVSEHDGVHARARERRLPAAGGLAVRMPGLGDGVEPLDPVARARDPAVVRVQDRPRDHVSVRRRSWASPRSW
jgi:hypothetical protein